MRNLTRLKTGVPALEARRGGKDGERLVGANGEMNAGSRKELIASILDLADRIDRGEVLSKAGEKTLARSENEKKEAREALIAAYHTGPYSREWAEIGAVIGAEINESAERDGFMRRVLLRGDVMQGMFPRIRVRRKDIRAVYVSSDGVSVQSEMIRSQYMHPPEFLIQGRITVGQVELHQGPGDFLDEKFFELQEQILVKEDQLLIKLARDLVGVANDLLYISGGFNPAALAALQGGPTEWGLPSSTILMAANVRNNILGSSAFASWFDPVSQHDMIMTGNVGSVLGTTVLTDAFRDPALRVLTKGDIWVFTDPQHLGVYTDRGPIQTQELNTVLTVEGRPGRGWHFHEMMSMTVQNARGVVQGSMI